MDGVPEVDAPLIPYSDCEAQVTGGSGSMLHEVVKRSFHLQQKRTQNTLTTVRGVMYVHKHAQCTLCT